MRIRNPALLVLLAAAVAGCGSSSSSSSQPPPSTPAQTPTQPPAQAKSASGCKQVPLPQGRQPKREKKPTKPLDSSKKWSLTFRTNCGDFTVALDLKTAPKASASLVSLARSGYFDKTIFHRIAPGFVIQGGDPTASGAGGPGYKTVDKPPKGARYTHGVVAMAKTGNEPPGTGGSQFFVVTGTDSGLTPDYAIVGKVSKGLDVVDRIGALGDQGEQPTEVVEISGVDVSTK